MTIPKSGTVYDEPVDGWKLDISRARGGGPGTESNRARAARGDLGGDVLSAAMVRDTAATLADNAGPPPVVFDTGPGCDQTLHFRWDGEDYAVPVLASDTAADMAAKVAAATGGTVQGGVVVYPRPSVPRSDGMIYEREGVERPGDHESPTGERVQCNCGAQRSEDHAGGCPASRPGVAADGPLQYGRPINGHREMVAAFGGTGRCPTPEEAERLYGRGSDMALRVRAAWELSERGADGTIVAPEMGPTFHMAAPGDALRADPSPRWQAKHGAMEVKGGAAPQPTPAPGQVWLPPPVTSRPVPLDADGTVTVSAIQDYGHWVAFVGGGGIEQCEMTMGPGWTCVGVATPHGRVMVGDGFAFGSCSEIRIARVLGGATVEVLCHDGTREPVKASELLDPQTSGYHRTCYAPARAGERYRCRQSGSIHVVDAGAGLTYSVDTLERLDPGSALPEHGTLAEATALANELRTKLREPSSVLAFVSKPVGASKGDARAQSGDRQPGETNAAWTRRLTGADAPPAIHADFCARGLGPVESLAIPSRGEVAVFLPSPPPGHGHRIDARERYYAERLPVSTCFTVRAGERVDRAALEGVAHTLIVGVPVRERTGAADREPRTTRVTLPITPAMRDAAALKLGAPRRLTLSAPARDLRALADAIGRALESDGPQGLYLDGHPLTVARDEMLFSPTCKQNSVVSAIVGDARALRALRRCVNEALTTAIGSLAEWCKGQSLLVTRIGGRMPPPAPPPDTTPTSYTGSEGGAQGWRWGVGE